MSGVAVPLAVDIGEELLQLVVILALFVRPVGQVVDDPLQVLDAVVRRAHCVVPDRLGLRRRILAVRAGEPVDRVLLHLGHHLVQDLPLGVHVLAREAPVAPLDGELVVRPDHRHEAGIVAGLRDVVEAGVVHDGRRHAVLAGEVGAQVLDGVGGRRLHVVLQPDRVPDLVGRHEADQLTHQLVAELDAAGLRVHRRGLDEEPVPQEVHDVVVPLDVRLQDVSRPRIVDVRAGGVLRPRREIPDHRVAGILGMPLRIVLRRVGRDDRVGESGLLEGHLPVLDALREIRAPLLGRGRVDVVDDRLDRLDEFAAGVGLGVGGFEPPPDDVLALLGALRVVAVVDLVEGDVANALVEEEDRKSVV